MVAYHFREMQAQLPSGCAESKGVVFAEPRILNPKKEAARLLGISVRKLDYLIADGRLRASRIDGRVLLHRDELERFAKQA